MALDGISKLGTALGKLSSDQSEIKQNISPDETDAIDYIVNYEEVVVEGTVIGTKRTYASDSFIIDHPVLGDIDSSTLKIDGGYDTNELTIPVTMPITLGETSEVLFTVTL